MPSEALKHPLRQQARTVIAATPPRLRPKGPVGPDFYRQLPAAAGRPKQSAVERLEADKAKYVKSQVALTKQQPVKPPEVQKSLLSPATALRPTRKTQTPTKAKQEEVQLNLKDLSKLISGVNDGPPTNVKAEDRPDGPESTPQQAPAGTPQKKERPCPPPRPDWSSPAKMRLKASSPSGPARVESPSSQSPAAGTVRRVDVMPQAGPVRTPCRPPLFIRQPLQPLHPQSQLRPAASNLRPLPPRLKITPVKPVIAVPPKPENPASPPEESTPVPSQPLLSPSLFPPPSPAITRLSSSSSRKRRSLTRSKSDMSDRFSRAGTELERFFNLCGLDPADLQEWTGSSSDIVSMARFRSVSAPGSEVAGSDKEEEEDEEEEDAGKAAARAPYGVSVIERNARVIKWLYGLRHAKDNANKSTDL